MKSEARRMVKIKWVARITNKGVLDIIRDIVEKFEDERSSDDRAHVKTLRDSLKLDEGEKKEKNLEYFP